MGILVGIIVILVGFVIYSFGIKPAVTDYVIDKQVEAQNFVIEAILLQLQQTGYVQIPLGNETLILVPYQQPAAPTQVQ